MNSSPSSHRPKKDFWHDGLRLVSFCPMCEAPFQPTEARILGEDAEAHLVHVRCRTCKNAVLALVRVTKSGVSSVGLVTDLSYDDVIRCRAGADVSVDDVLEIHELLERGELPYTLLQT
jgi:hypothetical protein